jgi:hypothetical protein
MCRIALEMAHAPEGASNLDLWNPCLLLRQSVAHDDCASPVEEIEHAEVDALMPHSQLVNAIAKHVGMGSPQIVSLLGKQLEADDTLVTNRIRKVVQPVQDWNAPVGFAESHDGGRRHPNLRIV